jgi:hypothetical protein
MDRRGFMGMMVVGAASRLLQRITSAQPMPLV